MNRIIYSIFFLLLIIAPSLGLNVTITQAPSVYANDTSYNATLYLYASSFSNNTAYNATIISAISSFSNNTEQIGTLLLMTLNFFDIQQPGNETLSVIVTNEFSSPVTNATVNGTITAPNGTQTQINFTETATGNYTKNFTFDTVGNWTIAVSASKAGFNNISSAKNIYIGLIELASFTGIDVYQSTTASFSFGIKNKGNVTSSNVSSSLFIYDSTGGLVFSKTGSSVSVSAGQNLTNTLTWSVGSTAAGTYNATGYLNFTDTNNATALTPNRTFLFQVLALPPTAPTPSPSGGGGGGPTIIIIKNVTQAVENVPVQEFIQFSSIPILIEAYPGYRTTQPVTIFNPLDTPIDGVRMSVKNIPDTWFFADKDRADLQPGQTGTFTINFIVPGDAQPGNYQGSFSFTNGDYLRDFAFILRVNQVLPGQTSLISKESVVHEVSERTNFVIFVKNKDKFLESLSITERVDKSIASNVNELEFSVPPTKVIQPDPIIQWTFKNLFPNEQRNITYRVKKVINTTRPFIQTSIEEIVSIERVSEVVPVFVNLYDFVYIIPIAVIFILVIIRRIRKSRARESLSEARKLAERLRG